MLKITRVKFTQIFKNMLILDASRVVFHTLSHVDLSHVLQVFLVLESVRAWIGKNVGLKLKTSAEFW